MNPFEQGGKKGKGRDASLESVLFHLDICYLVSLLLLLSGVKEYSNWPTIPQVFIGGEFVGGCDIMLDMHKNGELIEELKKVGIRSALLDRAKEND